MARYMKVLLAALLIVSGVFVFSPSGYVIAGGLVMNQSFEEGYGYYQTDNWLPDGNARRTDTGPIYAGGYCAILTGSSDMYTQWIELAGSGIGYGNYTVPLTYEAWGWIYVSGNVTGVIALDFWHGTESEGGIPLSSTEMLSATNTNGTYVQRTTTMQAPPGTDHLRIRLLGTGWEGGVEVRFDEIGFYPLTGYCFIATAAYGTETASQLNILRDFRDQVLLKNALGSLFVEAYYKLSPPVADFISKSDFLRTVVREVLVDPVVNLLQWSQDLWRA
jgi:hypothetical protein